MKGIRCAMAATAAAIGGLALLPTTSPADTATIGSSLLTRELRDGRASDG